MDPLLQQFFVRKRWDYTNLTGVCGWFDASAYGTITQAASAVSAWRSRVGNISLVQATGGQQPIYSPTGRNNRPSISFDGIDDGLAGALPASFPSGSQAYTAIMVAYKGATDAGNYLNVFQYGTPGATGQVRALGSHNDNMYAFYYSSDQDSGVVWSNTDKIATVELSAGSGPTSALSVDGAAPNLFSAATNITPSASTLYAGRGPSGDYLTCQIQELVFLNKVFASPFERARAQGRAAWKWGLQGNLPASHPFKNWPPMQTVEDDYRLRNGLWREERRLIVPGWRWAA
jgi:hypothetical protein